MPSPRCGKLAGKLSELPKVNSQITGERGWPQLNQVDILCQMVEESNSVPESCAIDVWLLCFNKCSLLESGCCERKVRWWGLELGTHPQYICQGHIVNQSSPVSHTPYPVSRIEARSLYPVSRPEACIPYGGPKRVSRIKARRL